MKLRSVSATTLLLGQALSLPLGPVRREVPQEHSHDLFLSITNEALAKSNPKGIKDAVFGLLGNAAAAGGAGSVTNTDCLKQETADQAFTNGKAAGDVRLMAGALVYQALERNTGKVGLASVACTEQAVNPEIRAVKPHQDPASANAASINKGITLELARQLKSIGADPNLALLSGTFAPGDLNDATAKGNSCDDPDPKLGCIFTTGKLVLDASQEEVASAAAAVAQTFTGTGGIQASDLVDLNTFSTANAQAVATATAASDVATTAPAAAAQSTRVKACLAPSAVTQVAASSSAPAAAAAGNNVQTFTGTLGGPPPPVISGTGDRPFSVNGDTFVNSGAALQRSCDVQHNACANAANSGKLAGGVGQCDSQNNDCRAAAAGGAGAGNAGNTGNAGNNGNANGNGNNGNNNANGNGNGNNNNANGNGNGNGNGNSSGNNNNANGNGNGNSSGNNGDNTAGNGGNNNNNTGNSGDNTTDTNAATSFGSCSNPSIKFAEGLDGRKEAAFAPVDQTQFNHGSALNIKIVADFICDRLNDQCKAGDATVTKCRAASAAASQQKGQAAADAFNQALGAPGN